MVEPRFGELKVRGGVLTAMKDDLGSFDDFLLHASRRLRMQYRTTGRTTRLIGIVFAPTISQETSEILKYVPSWNELSGNLFDFYWPGYQFWLPDQIVSIPSYRLFSEPNRNQVTSSNPEGLFVFDASLMHRFVEEFECAVAKVSSEPQLRHFPGGHFYTGHIHYGETDIVLLDCITNPETRSGMIDVSSGVVVHLSHLRRIGSEISPGILFNHIVQSSRDLEYVPPVNTLLRDLGLNAPGSSNRLSIRVLLKALREFSSDGASAATIAQLFGWLN